MTFNNKQVIALIPARGGSKGVPRKNLRFVRSKPLVCHTILAAIKSAVVDTVYLSSEDEEILKIGIDMDVNVIKRSVLAASDTATASQVVIDSLDQMPQDIIEADPYIVYLQPTSPLRTAVHIDGAFTEMATKGISTCLSVVMLQKSPYKSFKITDEGLLLSLFDEMLTNANRQEFPVIYYPNGAIYIFPVSEFIQKRGFPSNGSVPFVMSEKDSIDIDTEEDFLMMEKL
tara:strand:- start:4169 stop:4858 length:690 start_codon:yes stop_codon:yes gene_type:complete